MVGGEVLKTSPYTISNLKVLETETVAIRTIGQRYLESGETYEVFGHVHLEKLNLEVFASQIATSNPDSTTSYHVSLYVAASKKKFTSWDDYIDDMKNAGNLHYSSWLWRGEEYSVKMVDPRFDAMVIQDQIFFAVSNHEGKLSQNFITSFSTDIAWPGRRRFNRGTVVTHPSSYDEFVLLDINNQAYIAAAGYRKVDLFPAARESKEVKTLQLQGTPKQMKVFRDTVSLMVNNDMIHLLEYDGIHGLVVAATVKEKEAISSYCFVKGLSKYTNPNAEKDNYFLVTGDAQSSMNLYETTALNQRHSNLGCRYPEIPDLELESDYCDISVQHTMCRFKNADPGCKLEEFSLSEELKEAIVDEMNKERRIIANAALRGAPQLPIAENMRKVFWDDELARIAQIWAIQCNKELDYKRVALIDGVQVEFGQNIVMFEFKEEMVSLNHIRQLIQFWLDSYSTDLTEALIRQFNHLPIPPKENYDLSYYTQLAWAKTDRIGCGFARYRENDKEESTSTAVFVCNFAEEGNQLNKSIFEIGFQPCGNCGPGFKCEDNLEDGTLGALCVKA